MATPKKPVVFDVVIKKAGSEMIIPETMNYDQAITELERRKKYEEEDVAISEPVNGFVYDAAIAFNKAMAKMFGWVSAERTPGFFGSNPPQLIAVPISHKETTRVPWGRFTVPGITGWLSTGIQDQDGHLIMVINAQVKRKHEETIKELARLTRDILAKESIFRSKPIQVQFRDEDDELMSMPNIKFMDLDDVNPNQLIFSDQLTAQINTNLFTPIIKTKYCEKSRIPIKRGVLLAGKYGTGKTLAARVTAYHAVHNGWTFIYISSPTELPEAIAMARDYQPAVIFSEDIDRAAGEERDDSVNEILNTLDGIDTKNSKIMVVLTTNHLESINQAMFRPGRLDAVITVEAPDAAAAIRLVRLYGGDQISDNEDLTHVGERLAGQIPAVIRECVERSKLYAISLATVEELEAWNGKPPLTGRALLYSAEGMTHQLQLLNPPEKLIKSNATEFGEAMGKEIAGGMSKVMGLQKITN